MKRVSRFVCVHPQYGRQKDVEVDEDEGGPMTDMLHKAVTRPSYIPEAIGIQTNLLKPKTHDNGILETIPFVNWNLLEGKERPINVGIDDSTSQK